MLDNPTKFLIVSEEHGIFLGSPDGGVLKWSKKDGEGVDKIPTFDEQYARRVIAQYGMTENPDLAKDKLLVKLVPATPDQPGFRLSRAALTAQGISVAGKVKPPEAGGPQPIGTTVVGEPEKPRPTRKG